MRFFEIKLKKQIYNASHTPPPKKKARLCPTRFYKGCVRSKAKSNIRPWKIRDNEIRNRKVQQRKTITTYRHACLKDGRGFFALFELFFCGVKCPLFLFLLSSFHFRINIPSLFVAAIFFPIVQAVVDQNRRRQR